MRSLHSEGCSIVLGLGNSAPFKGRCSHALYQGPTFSRAAKGWERIGLYRLRKNSFRLKGYGLYAVHNWFEMNSSVSPWVSLPNQLLRSTSGGATDMSMKNPSHPGDFIRTEIIEPAGLSVTAAAAALQVSRPALSSLLNGRADLSGDMALRIEKAFGVKMDTLMRMQSAYDIAQTRKREKEIRVRRFQPTADAHP
jgi:addiction module HigA family antidote